MGRADAIDQVVTMHGEALALRAQADAAARGLRIAVADAVDRDDVQVPELAVELDLSQVRVYQLARQGRELRAAIEEGEG